MSEHVTLALRAPLTSPVDASAVVPDAFVALSEPEIARLPLWLGRKRATVGDFFDVHGERSSSVRITGDVRRAAGFGTAMGTGSLTIDDDAGSRLGAAMTGGTIDVLGNVGDDAGAAMAGGILHVRGSAGNRLGGAAPGASRGMTGGTIVVHGSAGTDVGARMRRGLLFVGGNAGDRAACSLIAGTVIVLGRVGMEPAFASKRGSLVVCGGVEVPVTYRYACDYEPPHVRLMLTHVTRRYGVTIAPGVVGGRYRRYCGDAGTVAKGEILEWIRE